MKERQKFEHLISTTAAIGTLESLLAKIEAKCQEWNIFPFYGPLAEEEPLMTFWQKDGSRENDWEAFLQLFKASGASILHIDTYTYGVRKELKEAFQERGLDVLDEEAQQAFLQAYELLEQKEGELACVDLIFLCDGTYYNYERMSEWHGAYLLVTQAIVDFIDSEKDDEDEDDVAADGDDNPPRLTLSPEAREAEARKLMEHPRFLDDYRRPKSIVYLLPLLEEAGIMHFSLQCEIIARAHTIYGEEVAPVKEKELIQSIQKLKEQGLSKTAIMGRLRIGRVTLERYYHLDNNKE